jgi:hypothetical protein
MRDQVSQNVVKVEHVDAKEKIVDIFTKPLPRSAYENLQ